MNTKTPFEDFQADSYREHNRRRFEHLDSLDMNLSNKSILEIGAGIGDHTVYLLAKTPKEILATEARQENVDIFEERFSKIDTVKIRQMDMDNPLETVGTHDICYCYGLLYHLSKPEQAIRYIAKRTKETLLLETCVDYVKQDTVNLVPEDPSFFSQSYSGTGCRPGRRWLFSILKQHFQHVYEPRSQPNHEQFPTDWSLESSPARLTRAVFVASHLELPTTKLASELLYKHTN